MDFFNLPQTTKVQRVVPKNAFDAYTNTRQKKLFTDLVARITWLNKLSPDTINLIAKEVLEIQVFKIELKVREDIQPVVDIIDKAIPYLIIFIIEYEDSTYLSTSAKHPHPVNENISVLDWTFKSDWFHSSKNQYEFHLKNNLDTVYKDFCLQILDTQWLMNESLEFIIQHQQQIQTLKKEISRLESGIKRSKQFNEKVELNMQLKEKKEELEKLMSPAVK